MISPMRDVWGFFVDVGLLCLLFGVISLIAYTIVRTV
jgi:hypothetical protein